MIRKGSTVYIKTCMELYGGALSGKVGVVSWIGASGENIGVLIDGMDNPRSSRGYFYLPIGYLTEVRNKETDRPFRIKNVYFNGPVTVVLWEDGTKTVVRSGKKDIYDPEKGLAMAIAKKALGNKGNYYNELKKWLPKQEVKDTNKNPKEKQADNKFVSNVTALCFTCRYRDLDPMTDPCRKCSYDNGYEFYNPRKNCDTCRYINVDRMFEPCSICLASEDYCPEYVPAR